MARPAKTLEQHLRDGTFRARRHHSLLNGPFVGEKRLRKLQEDYKASGVERERRAIALDFQEDAAKLPSVGDRLSMAVGPGLAVADFFEQNLRHVKGPAAGRPFVLEPWQRQFVEELYRVDERGQRIYKRAILGVPRGNGKSPIAAAVGRTSS
jgi:hypothetical protein